MSKTNNLTELISVRTLEKIQDNFSRATGIPCVIRDLKGEAVTKFSNPNKLWLEVIKNPEIEKETYDNLLKVLEKCQKSGQIEIYKRYIDTYAFAVPIIINGQIIAFFIGGLVRFGNPNMATCSREAEKLHLDLDSYLEMYLELPLVEIKRLEACANLLKMIGSIITNNTKIIEEAELFKDLNREHSNISKEPQNVTAAANLENTANHQ